VVWFGWRRELDEYYYSAYHSQEELEAELGRLAAAYPHLVALYTIGATRAANQLLAIRLATVSYHSQEELGRLVAAYPHLAALYTIGANRAANQLLAIRIATVSYHSQEELGRLVAVYPHLAALYTIGANRAADQLLAIRLATVSYHSQEELGRLVAAWWPSILTWPPSTPLGPTGPPTSSWPSGQLLYLTVTVQKLQVPCRLIGINGSSLPHYLVQPSQKYFTLLLYLFLNISFPCVSGRCLPIQADEECGRAH
jgi:biotin operon repressor